MSSHWLCRLTVPDPAKAIMSRPFQIVHRGETWSAATNGRLAVYLRGAIDGIGPPGDGQEHVSRMLIKFLKPRGCNRKTVLLADIKAWAGPPVIAAPCPECQGRSKISEHVYCSFCDGDGEMEPDPRPGCISGISVNRNLLALALEHLAGDRLTLHTAAPGNEAEPLWLETSDWLVAIMPMAASMARQLGCWEVAPRIYDGISGGQS